MKKSRGSRRPLRKSTQAPKKKSDDKKSVETHDNLKAMLVEYRAKLVFYEFRVARLSDLLSRNSAAKIPDPKKAKMARQLEEAQEERSFALVALDQIAFRIEQLPEEKHEHQTKFF